MTVVLLNVKTPRLVNHKLITPDLRKDFIRLRDQMAEFADPLIDLCDSLQVIRDAVVDAQELADCLIDDDLFGACEVDTAATTDRDFKI